MSLRERLAWLIAVVALAGAACGARVEPLSGPGFAGQPGFPQGPGNPVVNPTTGETIPGLPNVPVPAGSPTPGVGVVVPGGPPDASCRGGKTDVGVTPTTVKVGAVISITGPLPGAFNAARDAIDSYFKALNEQGGICGRRVQLLVRDDGGDTANNARVTRQLLDEDEVFAFVGSQSANDDGMASVLCPNGRSRGVPDIAFPIGWNHTECPTTYGVPGQIQRRLIGEGASGSRYLNDVNDITQVALFWLQESETSILSAWGFEAAMLKARPNLEVCFEQQTGVFETGFFQYVNNMKDKCDPDKTAVYMTMENNSNIRLAKAMDSQGFHPKVFAPTFTSYVASFIAEAEGTTEGAYIAVPQIPFERCAERNGKPVPPCSHAELQTYVTALNRFHPGSPRPGAFGGPAWGQGSLFAAGLRACGANLTRRCLLNFLDTTGPFTANGFVSPTAPGDHEVYHADLLLQVRGDRFVEVPRPPGHPGPPEAPVFWDSSKIFDWWDYYCAHKDRFTNTATKDKYIKC